MKHANWHVRLSSEIKSTYGSVRLPNICAGQVHCPHTGTKLSSCDGEAPAGHQRRRTSLQWVPWSEDRGSFRLGREPA